MRFLDRAQSRIPQPWRTLVDWVVTLALAVGFVLAFEAQVAKPYRIPSSSMEPRARHGARRRCLYRRPPNRVAAR